MSGITKVFALLVGIDDYPTAPLSGCVSDARKMLAYLQKDKALNVDALTLLNGQATKTAIVDGFRKHLSRAQEGEAALFYFSGHGAQEWADPEAWPNESDQRLETIACYDPSGRAALMADKELRLLIHELAGGKDGQPKAGPPHILTIFDCCHSGDNTRSAAFKEKEPAVRQKRFTNVFPQRPWSDFLFAKQYSPEDFAAKPITELLPEGRHIQLAAALDNQPALEVAGEGLFTKNLLGVLERTGGGISYASLHSLVSNYIRHQYQQNPQLYVQGGDPGLMYMGFLGRQVDAAGRLQGLVSFSKTKGWLLDAGAMHGISRDAKLRMKTGPDRWVEPTIRQLEPGLAFLDIQPDIHAQLDKNQAYPCEVSASYPLRVLVSKAEGDEGLMKKLEAELDKHSARIQRTELEAEADYVLHARYGKLYITPPFRHHYPQAALVSVARLGDEKAIGQAIRQLEHIANWEFVRRLHNANVRLFKKPPIEVKVSYEKGGQWVELPYQEKGAAVDSLKWKEARKTYGARLKVELTNQFGQDLWYSLLFLTINFESNAGLMEKPVELIKKGETVTVFAHRGGEIPFNIEQQIFDYNQPETHLWFQLVVSTQNNIEVPPLLMPELAPPPGAFRHRGVPLDEEETTAGADPNDWTTQLVHIAFRNPRYNRVSQERLMGMLWSPGDELSREFQLDQAPGNLKETLAALERSLLARLGAQGQASGIESLLGNNEMAPFAAANFLDTSALSGKLQLKEAVELLDEGAEPEQLQQKSLLWDVLLRVANTYGHTVRMVDFERRVKKYPGRVLMVAEGDSWFQHPQIREIIGHLSLFFNIYCRSAAGDEMQDYLQTGDFIDAIDRIEARLGPKKVGFFLISGGGNDILGAQFKDFLIAYGKAPEKAEGEDCKRFLNQRFFEKLDEIMGLYEMTFQHLQAVRPELKVLTHGYDYVIPKGPEEPGMSWLGKPMTEQGILRPGDRRGITNYLIDEFNKRLMAVAARFPQVAHIDARGAVHDYQWADEIHPNSEGFQNVARRYMKAIDELLAKPK